MGQSGTSKALRELANRRLDSWKEIAAFFDRDERTVKRWEKERRLPVHRLQESAKGPVYAFTDELLDWMAGPVRAAGSLGEPLEAEQASATERGRVPTAEVEAHGPGEGVRRKRWILVAVALGCVVTIGIAAGAFFHRSALPPAVAAVHPPAPSANPDAEALYLKGRYEWSQRTPASLNKAVDYFTQAIVRDADYAPAYVGLADCYNLLREYSTMAPEEAYPRALAAARKAVELDDGSAEAHTSLAFATFYGNLDAATAEHEFRRALELDPSYGTAHHWYATFLLALGRIPESLAQIEIAQKLDPASTAVLADKGLILLFAGRRDEGTALLKQVQSAEPAFPSTYRYLVTAYFLAADYPAWLDAREKVASLTHDEWERAIVAAGKAGYAAGGQQAMFAAMLVQQKKLYDTGHASAIALAGAYARAGEDQQALRYLEIAQQRREPLVGVQNDTSFARLRADPAFRRLLIESPASAAR